MKKITMLFAGIAFAASAHAQISFAPEIGLNLANMQRKVPKATGSGTETLDGGIKLGIKAGVNANIPLGDRLMLQPGLFYSIKGVKSEQELFLGITAKENVTLHYAEIPLMLNYMFNDPDEGRFFIGVGPYLGIAFSGKNKVSVLGIDSTISMTFGSDSVENNPMQKIGRFDYGAGVNVGYFLRSGIFFRGTYQMGIGNLYPSEIRQDNSYRNSVITISIGYQLGGRDEASPSRRQKAKTEDATM